MGHDHDAHHELKIPKADTYTVKNYPGLGGLEQKLAKEGLKDPWLRNFAWRFNPKIPSVPRRALTLVFRGWKVGVAAFLITIGVENALGITYSHGHDEDHGDNNHH